MTLPDCITLHDLAPGYPVYDIRHATATARIALNGAHVMEWTPAGQKPGLYLSPDAVLEEGKPIRGGIPVCWPWFNAHPTDTSKPMHGFARNRFWTFAAATESTDGVQLTFALESNADTLALWSHAFEATLQVTIGAALSVALTTRNTGETTFEIAEALHTYLATGEISGITIRGLDGIDYLDTVGERVMRKQSGDIIIDREVDRQYVSASSVTVEDTDWQRTLTIEKEGSGTTVVWNPWIEKSKRLADLPDEAYHGFLCIEAANAGEAVVTVPPGEERRISTTIRIAPLTKA